MSFNCLITTLGQAKIAAAIASGSTVSATHIAIGDGNGNGTTPNVSQTALVREVYRTTVSSISVNAANTSQIIFEAVINATIGGWTARELGLFDSAGDMIAVANIGSVYKPTASEGSAREMVVRIYAQVDQVAAINLVVDPAFYIATRSWVAANYSLAALLPGGTTGQILRKKSNANGDTEWVNPTTGQNITVDVVTEIQTLAASQTAVTLATATTSGMAVYVEGIRLRPNQYTIGSLTAFSLASSYPAGSKLLVCQNDPNASLDFLRKGNNLSEITSASTARTNLGLGTMAVAATADYVAKTGGTMTGDLTAPAVIASTTTKAWVCFNGTGSVSIKAAYNVSSITDGGVGTYQLNFTSALADANYCVVGSARGNDQTSGYDSMLSIGTPTLSAKTTSAVGVRTMTIGGTAVSLQDVGEANVAIFR